MGLRDIEFQDDYRTGYDDIVRDLMRPCLALAQNYWRAVGYFSSSALEAFGAELGEFIQNGGRIRLVTSVELSARDLDAIEKGSPKRMVCAERISEIIEGEFSGGVTDGVRGLLKLLELGRLEILIAVPKKGTGIYHEKIGLFFDTDDYVAFSGSSNESRNAFEHNRECVDVYTSWGSKRRAERKKDHFEALWESHDKGVDIYPFPEAARRELIRIVNEPASNKNNPKRDDDKWRHQEEAVKAFLAAERGILDMATGTGKTRTALKIIDALFSSDQIETVIVCTDGNDLLSQWFAEVLKLRNKLGISVYRNYDGAKELAYYLLKPAKSVLLVSREPLAKALKRIKPEIASRMLLIHDEVHGLGSPANRTRLEGLSDGVRFRLGLSATPEREYDDEGNDFLQEHVGPPIFEFPLEKAIRRGILAPFKYFPIRYFATEDDKRRIQDVYKRRAARAAEGRPMTDQEVWTEISRVHKTSDAKLPLFLDFIRDQEQLLERCIVFVETQEYGENVLEIIHAHRADFHTYFSGEQSETLRRFARAELECLITCHRVSEGIDIQSLRTVILFASARARLETIQRIGRCLRTDPEDPNKIASIVDFIRMSENNEPTADEERMQWLQSLSEISPENP